MIVKYEVWGSITTKALWGSEGAIGDCLYVCVQRAKEWGCSASINTSEDAGVHNVIGVSVMIGLNE